MLTVMSQVHVISPNFVLDLNSLCFFFFFKLARIDYFTQKQRNMKIEIYNMDKITEPQCRLLFVTISIYIICRAIKPDIIIFNV